MNIIRWDTGEVIYSREEAPSSIELVVCAAKEKNSLYRADLRGADLRGAYLRGADLRGADLRGADLRGADLQGAKNIPLDRIGAFQIVPEAGQFTAFKKVHADNKSYIAELIVPADAKRVSSLVGRKCRVSAARVIDVKTIEGEPTDIKEFRSAHDGSFVYRVGDLVEPREEFSDDITVECASGIHCFITRAEAVAY